MQVWRFNLFKSYRTNPIFYFSCKYLLSYSSLGICDNLLAQSYSQYHFIIFLTFIGSEETSTLTFLTCHFLISLARGLRILLIFSKNKVENLLIPLYCIIFVSFIFDLSFLLLPLVIFCFSVYSILPQLLVYFQLILSYRLKNYTFKMPLPNQDLIASKLLICSIIFLLSFIQTIDKIFTMNIFPVTMHYLSLFHPLEFYILY